MFKFLPKRKTSLLLRVSCFLYLLVPISCDRFCPTGSCCEDFQDYQYTIESMSFEVGSIPLNSGAKSFSSEPSSDWQMAALRVLVDSTNIFEASMTLEHKRFSIINKLYACDPPPPSLSQKFISMKLFSDQEVSLSDEIISPFSDLSKYFNVYAGYQLSEFDIPSLIQAQTEDQYLLGRVNFSLVFKPSEALTIPAGNFTVALELNDGTSFRFETEEYVID